MSGMRNRRGIEQAYRTSEGTPVRLDLLGFDQSDEAPLRVDRWSDDTSVELLPGTESDDFIYRRCPPPAAGLELICQAPDLYRVSRAGHEGPVFIVVDPTSALRLYTLIPRVCGPIAEWVSHLDRIQAMGFNAVQLLPITETGSSRSPYAISDHFAIDPGFGTGDPDSLVEEFDRFIDVCAKRNIRVCVDLVLNHFAVGGKAAREHRDWLEDDPGEPDGIQRAGWSDGRVFHPWRDLARLNFAPFSDSSKRELEEYLDEYALFWAERAAKTRGIIRLDNLHSSNSPYLRHLLQLIRCRYPGMLILGELFGDEAMILKTANANGVDLLLGTPWEHKFVPELRSYLYYIHRMHSRLGFHFPVSSHDSGTIVEEFGSPLATPPRLVVSTLLGSGSTGMVQGIEYGAERKIEFIGPITGFTPAGNVDFSDLVTRLNGLHRDHQVFQRPGNVIFVDNQHVAVIAALRIDPETGLPGFLVCANFDTSRPQDLELRPPRGRSFVLHDVISGDTAKWDGTTTLTYPPGGIAVYEVTES